MSNKNQETIADIVFAMRNEGHTGEASCLEWIRTKMTYYADRIEAAHKREILVERNLATDHIVALQDKAVKIYGEIGEMVGREASKKQSVTNCNHLGNAAKMREAMENIAEYAKAAACYTEDVHLLGYLKQIERWAESAIATPQRNCDVGTYEEQSERFTKFCGSQDCKRTCPFSDDYDSYRCEFAWAQMPYEEGGEK